MEHASIPSRPPKGSSYGGLDRIQWLQTLKTAGAAGLAWEVARWTGAERPYFAPLAAILCLQVTVAESVWQGYQRVLGIVFGVLVADTVGRWLGIHAWSLALLVFVGIALARWLHLGPRAVPQVGVSAMMVLAVGGGHYSYAWERMVDTALGALLAVLINALVWPPDYTPSAQRSVAAAGEALAQRMEEVAVWLQQGADVAAGRRLQEQTRAYLDTLHEASGRMRQALDALRFSPLLARRRVRLTHMDRELLYLRQGYAHLAGMLRTLLEWQAAQGCPEQERLRWAERLSAAADAVRWHTASAAVGTAGPAPAAPARAPEEPPLAQALSAALWNDWLQWQADFAALSTLQQAGPGPRPGNP